MNKRILSFSVIVAFALFAFVGISYSNGLNAPAARTNAPGETNCASSGCHAGVGLQEDQPSRISITADGVEMDDNFTYTPGTTYNMEFLINDAKARNGFSLTILNESNDFEGDLTTSSLNAAIRTTLGKKYVGHTNSSGVTFWEFEWTAPADSQLLTLYSVANLSNNDGFPSGDSILSKSFSFTSIADTTQTGLSAHVLSEKVQIINTGLQNGANFNITVDKVKYFNCAIYDINGNRISSQEYLLHTGKQNIQIPLEVNRGLYFLKLSSEGKSSTYRFLL